jgi:hypothetical protein
MKLINQGEIIKSPNKKYLETIVFVPFFFGKKQQMKRHALFMSEIGFDSVIFNLSYKWYNVVPRLKDSMKLGWGLKHVWTQEIKTILDSIPGPFFDLIKCNWNFFTHGKKKIGLKKLGWNLYARGIWTIEHEKEITRDLARLPKNFPILSIRGWLDPLVPTTAIEKAFKGHDHLDLEILNLPEGGHLDGLKKFPEIYKPRVTDFLKSVSTTESL